MNSMIFLLFFVELDYLDHEIYVNSMITSPFLLEPISRIFREFDYILPFLAQSQFHEFSVNSTFFLYSSHTLWWSEKFAITRTQCGDFGNFPSLQKFSSNWFTVKFFSEKVNLTEFLQNIVGEKFTNLHTTLCPIT